MQNILNRRSTRSYTDKPISDQVLQQLLAAAMQAPTAMNKQLWEFILIKDKETLKEITNVHPYSKMLLKAGAAIVVCGDTSKEHYPGFFVEDCSAATENILIAAESLGLGACWIGIYPVTEHVNALAKLLNLPENIIPVTLISLGYPSEHKPYEDRFDLNKIHLNSYGTKWDVVHHNKYLKIKISYDEYPDKFYRIMYVKPDINLLDLAIIFLDSVGSWFGHFFLYKAEGQEFLPSEWIDHPKHEFTLKDHTLKDVKLDANNSFNLTYDTGEDYEFTIEVLGEELVPVDKEALFIEGQGQAIVEDGKDKLNRIINGNLDLDEWNEFDSVSEADLEDFNEDFDVAMYNEDIEAVIDSYKKQLEQIY